MFTITVYPIGILFITMIVMILFGFGVMVGYRSGVKNAENRFVDKFISEKQ